MRCSVCNFRSVWQCYGPREVDRSIGSANRSPCLPFVPPNRHHPRGCNSIQSIAKMSGQEYPSEPPPAYSASGPNTNTAANTAAGSNGPSGGGGAAASNNASSATSGGAGHATSQSTGATAADGQRRPRRGNSLTEEQDIEQEDRPLPPGWVPQYHEESDHFFFVDTLHPNGPRSIWTHPLDDPEWLRTVPEGTDPLAYVHQLWANLVS